MGTSAHNWRDGSTRAGPGRKSAGQEGSKASGWTTPTGGRSRSAPASAATSPSSPRPPRSRRPALPVVDERERFAGILGEREFITALFPEYIGALGSAGFVPKSIDVALENSQRAAASSPSPST